MSMPIQEDIIDLKTVAKMLGLSYSGALKLAMAGKLPVWRTGESGQYRAFREDIEKHRNEHRVKRPEKELQ